MRKVLIVLTGVSLLIVACGDDDGGTTAATGSTETDVTGAAAETGPEECEDLTEAGSAFTVVLRDDFFEPACFTASALQAITLKNRGIALHTFTLRGTRINVKVEGGDTFKGKPLRGVVDPGTYELFCMLHEDVGMVGEVTVVE